MLQIYGVSRMLGQSSEVSSARQNMEKGSYQYMSENGFRGTAPTCGRPESFPETPKNPNVFSCISKRRGKSSTYFWSLQTIRNCPRNLRKCATAHGQKCPCVH